MLLEVDSEPTTGKSDALSTGMWNLAAGRYSFIRW
jgi:hypothetical protein